MLFADNNMTFGLPLGTASVLLKFYDLRNTEKVATKPGKMLEIKVIKDGKELYRINNKIQDAKFIRYSTFQIINLLLNNYKLQSYDDGSQLNLISFVIPLGPGLYIHIGSTYNTDEQMFDDDFSISLSNNDDIYQKPTICNSAFTDLSNIITSIKDFNQYLINELKAAELWEEYCEKNFLDIEWTPGELEKEMYESKRK